MSTRFSVIIPTYNRPSKLRRAIQSCLNQSLAPHEIIVVDNGENPKTPAIVDTFSKESALTIRYVRSEKFSHRKALATGIESATGDWLTLLDDDDFLAPDRIANDTKMIKDLTKDVILIIHDFVRVDYQNDLVWEHLMAHKELGLYQALAIDEFPPAAAVSFRTDAIQAHHSFHLKDGWMTEFDLYANLRPHGEIIRSGQVGYVMDDTRTTGRVTGSDIHKHIQAVELHRERFRETRRHLPSGMADQIDERLDQQQAFFCAKVLSFKAFFGETKQFCRAHPKESLKGIIAPLRGWMTRFCPSMMPEIRGSKTYSQAPYSQKNPSIGQLIQSSKLDPNS